MIKVSKMADYAVVVLAALARSDDALMTASGVSAKTGLPEPTVAKVLKLLSRGNFLDSVRGATGGYKLAMPPEKISVAKIITAVDGPISLTSCVDDTDQSCGYSNRCAVKGRWNGVNYAVRGALESVTLADMMNNECHSSRSDEVVIEGLA
ncbi:MAG: SUF system Fe-S cluster assembly regulator [Alphaproteobacteria bacterium]|jgi:FeS assembly SUF system regulator|nr:SUF system Fe-S cluster assembly regulator [Alphaproteobacteria bacterium]